MAIDVQHTVFAVPWAPKADGFGHANSVQHFGISGFSVGGDAIPPAVAVVSPAAGGKIRKSTPIVLDVTDNLGQLARVLLYATVNGVDELVHDGDRFGAAYNNSSCARAVVANGFRYTVLRSGGWPGNPNLWVTAFDRSGNELA